MPKAVPEGWKVSKGPTGITANSPDNGIQFLVAGSKSQDVLEAALRDLKANVTFKDVKIEKQGATVINGLGRIGYMKGGKDALFKDEDMADDFVREARKFITANKDRPFFLFFSANDIHAPRWPHQRFRGKSRHGRLGPHQGRHRHGTCGRAAR